MFSVLPPRARRAALRAIAGALLAGAAVAAAADPGRKIAPGAAPARMRCTPPDGDPLEAGTPVPAAAHVSAFASYRRLGETAVAPWKPANDDVGRIGGWRAYAREAAGPAPAAAAPAAPVCNDAPLPLGARP